MSNMIRLASGSVIISAIVRLSSARLHQCSASSSSVFISRTSADIEFIANPMRGHLSALHINVRFAASLQKNRDQLFAAPPIRLVETVGQRAVKVENAQHLPIRDHRYDHFGARL